MGCGESKHDAIATGNTTASRFRRRPNFYMKKKKDLDTILEVDSEASTTKESDSDGVKVKVAVAPSPPAGADVKNIVVQTEMKKKKKERGESMVIEEVGSPERFFSSRKDEDEIKAMVEAAGDARSGYCTPLLTEPEIEIEPEPDELFVDASDHEGPTGSGKRKQMIKIEEKLSTVEKRKEHSSGIPAK